MSKVLIFLLMLSTVSASAQKNPTEKARPIVAEGKLLYKSEMASWYGTDIFLENYKDQNNIGGYFSYTENQTSKCIFFSKAGQPKVIGTISFDSTYDVKTASVDLSERAFTSHEKDLYEIRAIALSLARSDTFFRTYDNTNLNFIPLINNNKKQVYILTAPQQPGVVIFGNDYLLTFNKKNKLAGKKRLHNNIIPISYGEEEEGTQIEGAMHSHLPGTGDFITATDICTLMLYAKFAKSKTHSVVSEKYLNLWNCETDRLTVIAMDAVKKMDEDQAKQKKKI